ncbi:hypothetical protein CDAR_246171 [Caerostris darwini]|uniref:Uncharacterized protein n=1 Tax=Caerostris darwini TaxID=1538125 RepID=A0AAV4SV09_9ARAC|nr:hypothetical protein CDAR_246171 [Caerostris darwini]
MLAFARKIISSFSLKDVVSSERVRQVWENYVKSNRRREHLSDLISNSARRQAQLKRPCSRMLALQQPRTC